MTVESYLFWQFFVAGWGLAIVSTAILIGLLRHGNNFLEPKDLPKCEYCDYCVYTHGITMRDGTTCLCKRFMSLVDSAAFACCDARDNEKLCGQKARGFSPVDTKKLNPSVCQNCKNHKTVPFPLCKEWGSIDSIAIKRCRGNDFIQKES